ncbi:MAG: FAD-dependent oxidoreductase [Pseudomonadota bacterium]
MIQSSNHFDIAIIGGGIAGLWAARHAVKRGERVVLIEKRRIGYGASGGFLGALMPHMPDSWNKKKQYQYLGLSTLADTISELEADTGLSSGYRRCGRIMPIVKENHAELVARRSEGASQNWDQSFTLTHSEPVGFLEWINTSIAKYGVQYDTLAARINPRMYVKTLATYLKPRIEVVEGVGVEIIEMSAHGGTIQLSNDGSVSADRIVVANGYEAYSLLQPFMGELNREKPIGRGVKGQAVLVKYVHKDDLPIVYHDGAYVVPHADNLVAIGSTSENDWEKGAEREFDPENMDFYRRAIDLVPALADAPIIDRWAGVRPRNTLEQRGTDPFFGPVPGQENLFALIGGFKITLGLAHLDVLGGEIHNDWNV